MLAFIKHRKDLVAGIVFFLLGGWAWWYAGTFPNPDEGSPGPGLMPRMIAIGLLFSGVYLAVQDIRKPIPDTSKAYIPAAPMQGVRMLGGILVVVLYPFVQPFTGFIPALSLVCLGICLLLKVRIWIAVLTAVLTAVIIYFLFTKMLGVML